MATISYFEPQRLYRVAAFRGVGQPRRVFGTNLGKAEALKRAALAARIWPEMASPQLETVREFYPGR